MVEKMVKKFGLGSPPPPLFGQCPKENIFSLRTASLIHLHLQTDGASSRSIECHFCFQQCEIFWQIDAIYVLKHHLYIGIQ